MPGLWKVPIPNTFTSSLRSIVAAADAFGFPPCACASDVNEIARALRHCGRISSARRAKSLHAKLIKHGLFFGVFLANNLIAVYAELGVFGDAQRMFDEMPERNVVSWTASISAHNRAGNPVRALQVFTDMVRYGLEEPNGFTFSAALKACAMVGDLDLGKWIHERVLTARLLPDTALTNALLDMYVKCGSLDEARRVFDGNFRLNATSWNTMIAGYCRGGEMDEAEKLFLQIPNPDAVSFNTIISGLSQIESSKALEYVHTMHKLGVKLDHFTFPCALKVCGSLKHNKLGEQLHSYIIKYGFESDCVTGSSLIDMHSKCGQVNEATRIFEEYIRCKDSISCKLPLWNSMVSGFTSNGYYRAALDLVVEIHHHWGAVFDACTLSSALKICITLQHLRVGLQVHGFSITSGFCLDYIVGSVLVDLYAKCGSLDDALRVFAALPHKDVVAWAGMITGCVQKGSNHQAFSFFKEMISLGIGANCFVVSSILKACSILAGLEGGKQLHAHCIKGGFELESITTTSLIDMYSKCGEIDEGLKVFICAREKDTVCWTGMIVGCGCNGRAIEALKLFEEMLRLRIQPNEITFLGVLSACRHAGLVGEACKYFKLMGEYCELTPSLEHYCCMVDILSRAGRIEEAKQLVSGMPYKPDETMGNSLLGACMTHHCPVLGEPALEHPLPVSLYSAPSYVILSNVYASMNQWDGSAKLREVMRSMSMREAGRSWVEVRA